MNKIKYFTLLIITLLVCTNCDEDAYDVVQVQHIYPEAEMMYPYNPETGVSFTADEVLALDYNPLKEGYYTKGEQVILNVRTSTKPSKVSLIKGEDSNRMEITDVVENAGVYLITLDATLEALGVESGKTMGLAFEISYNTPSPQGLLQEHVTYKVHRRLDPRTFNSFTFFDNEVQTFTVAGDEVLLDQGGVDLSFRYEGDYSVSIWVNTTATNSDPSMIGDKNWNSGSREGFVFAFRGGDWKLNIGDGSNRVDISGTPINDGNWHLLTATFDRDGDAVIYQDLVEIDRKDMSAIGNMDSGMPIYVGQDGTGTYGKVFIGQTREVYFHDVALTKDELKKIFD